MSWSSKVKYSQLPTSDSGTDWRRHQDSTALDFSSAFSYKSAFTYSKVLPPYVQEERSYDPPFVTRVCSAFVLVLSYLFVFLTFPISGWIVYKNIQQYERLVVFRLGRLQKPKGPGRVLVLPFVDKGKRVDMRTRAFNVPPQELLTNDDAAISVGATVYHRITDVALSVANIQDLNHSTRVLGQTVLLSILSSQSLKKINNFKQHWCEEIQRELNTATVSWGCEVSRVELSEITVIQETPPMNAEKVGGLLGQLAGQIQGQMGGGPSPQTSWLQSLIQPASGSMQPVLLPPMTTPKQETPLTDVYTPDDIIATIRPVLDAGLVRAVDAVFVFHITGEIGGTYYLELKTGSGSIGKGEHPTIQPDVTLTTSLHDMQAMFIGQLRPFVAYMNGQLVLEGDREVAMRLQKVIERVQEAKC